MSFRRSGRRSVKQRSPREEPRPSRTAPSSGTITKIAAQEHNPNRVSVFLDGEFAFGIGLDAAASQQLDVGQELPSERVKEIKIADEIGRATESALGLLAARPRSVREIRDRLRRKGYEPATIDRAIEKLEGWNYVDDTEFARYWVENRSAHKPRGHRLLEQELRQKGVDRELVKKVISAAEIDEAAAALDLARAKFPSYKNEDPQVARRKLIGFLQRRGFDYDVIKPALDQLFGEIDDELEPDLM
ncbi:MAG: regulatory protein RecX [Thermomicrobiales bacterium]